MSGRFCIRFCTTLRHTRDIKNSSYCFYVMRMSWIKRVRGGGEFCCFKCSTHYYIASRQNPLSWFNVKQPFPQFQRTLESHEFEMPSPALSCHIILLLRYPLFYCMYLNRISIVLFLYICSSHYFASAIVADYCCIAEN